MIEYTEPVVYAGRVLDYLVEVMDKYDIKAPDVARALGKDPRGVYYWFEDPERGEKHVREIAEALDVILTKKGVDTTKLDGMPSRLQVQGWRVEDAMRKSVIQICNNLGPLELETLERVAWSLYQQAHPYPYFYEHGADREIVAKNIDEAGNATTVTQVPAWFGDGGLRRRSRKREAAESAHEKAETLANETIETGPNDPNAGRWDTYARRVNDKRRTNRAAEWRQWLDDRPADEPMTAEVRELLAILELEAPTADRPADDAHEGAEPTQ